MSRLYFKQGASIARNTADADPQYASADALFEMLLMRLRAFDSFFMGIGDKDSDAHATDWDSGWTARAVFKGSQRASA